MAEQRREGVKKLFRERMGIAPHDDNGAYMTFVVPREHTREVVALLETLERSSRQLGVADVQLSMTSLEEVFLNIAKQAEIDEAQRKGTATKAVALPGGGTIFVPIGADTITDAQGVVWRVVWAQSEDGSLEVMDLKPVEQ